jgi:hypothetical protein
MQVVSLRVGGRALRVSDAADTLEAPATLPQASLSASAAAPIRSVAPQQPTLREDSTKHAAIAAAHTVATGGTVDDRRRMRRERRRAGQQAVIDASVGVQSAQVATFLSQPSADTGGKPRSGTPVRSNESVASSGVSKAQKPYNSAGRPAGIDTVSYFLKAAASERLLTHDEEVALALHLREQQVNAVISCNGFGPQAVAAV